MNIDQHIVTFENFLTPTECKDIIDHYVKLDSLNLSYSRYDLRDAPAHKKQDKSTFVLGQESMRFSPDMGFLIPFLEKFWSAYDKFLRHYSILGETGQHRIRSMKIQKTLPGEGYHVWHFESDSAMSSDRICAWAVYLNTIDSGGETEFLYQKKRIPATEGNLIIWPATYTHVHRGNPPLDGEKYILTGWTEWV